MIFRDKLVGNYFIFQIFCNEKINCNFRALVYVSFALNESGLAIVADKTDEIYIKGSGTGATIYCTGDFDKFVSVEMDGSVVDPSNYSVADGSTVLTFTSAYLDTLATGRHTVTMNYIDGSVSTTLTILDKDSAGAAGGSGSTNSTTASGTGSAANSGSPVQIAQTGDQTNIAFWVILSIISASACVIVFVRRRKTV